MRDRFLNATITIVIAAARPAKYANQEFFTEAQRQELDKGRAALLGRRATDREFAGAYNLAVFTSSKHTGARTRNVSMTLKHLLS